MKRQALALLALALLYTAPAFAGIGEAAADFLSDAGNLELVIGAVVGLLTVLGVSNGTAKRVDALLMTWAPLIVRGVRQSTPHVDDVTGVLSDGLEDATRKRTRELMREAAVEELVAVVPKQLRAAAKLAGVDVAARAAATVEAAVNTDKMRAAGK